MGNITTPIRNILNAWTVDKKLLLWRILSVLCCVAGTAIYMRPLEPYLDAPIFGVLVPTFISGYIIVYSIEIFTLIVKKEYVFLEICFVVIGGMGCIICGTYQLLKWVNWIITILHEEHSEDYNIPEFILALIFLFQFASSCAVLVHRAVQMREYMDRTLS